MEKKRIAKVIDKNKRFLILTHIFIEGDALGSQIALGRLLKKKDKDIYLVGERRSLAPYSFLSGIDQIKDSLPQDEEIDVAISVDCASKERLGKAVTYFERAKTTVNIDHHPGNTRFADFNWIEPDASSTGEMIYCLFKELKEEPDKDDALCMYVAILTDTGSFRYVNTTPRTHQIVAVLLQKGIRPEYVSKCLYESRTYDDITLLREALAGMELSKDGRIAWLRLTPKMLKNINYSEEMVDSLIGYPRSIKTVRVAILFRELGKKKVKMSFRSKYRVDVARLASIWGGGGHPRASGCTITGNLEEIEKEVIERTRRYLQAGDTQA